MESEILKLTPAGSPPAAALSCSQMYKVETRPPGPHLYNARLQAGLSQTQIAEQLDITQPSYADWERRSVALKPEYLPKLAQILNVPVDYLLGAKSTARRGPGPAGKARQVFAAVSRLPRKQQQKVIEMAEGFLALHESKTNGRALAK